MTKFERIKSMGIIDMAKAMIKSDLSDYCKSDCSGMESDDPAKMCTHELECCIMWLGGEEEEKNEHNEKTV